MFLACINKSVLWNTKGTERECGKICNKHTTEARLLMTVFGITINKESCINTYKYN